MGGGGEEHYTNTHIYIEREKWKGLKNFSEERNKDRI